MRTFAEIAREIKSLWDRSDYGWCKCAIPYLDAMLEINSTSKDAPYYYEDAQTVVLYFLANVDYWRGEDARRIKAELKAMVA